MAGELLDIGHQQGAALLPGCSANAFAIGDVHTGNRTLERPEHQLVAHHTVEPRPPKVEGVVQHGSGIGHAGDGVLLALEEGLELLEEQAVFLGFLQGGEVAGIVTDYLYDYWNWYTKKYHLLEGTTLKCEEIPAVTWCDDCKITYSTIAYGKTCPHCGSGNTWLLRGNEMRIKSIEIVEPDSGEEGKAETLEAGGEYRP